MGALQSAVDGPVGYNCNDFRIIREQERLQVGCTMHVDPWTPPGILSRSINVEMMMCVFHDRHARTSFPQERHQPPRQKPGLATSAPTRDPNHITVPAKLRQVAR